MYFLFYVIFQFINIGLFPFWRKNSNRSAIPFKFCVHCFFLSIFSVYFSSSPLTHFLELSKYKPWVNFTFKFYNLRYIFIKSLIISKTGKRKKIYVIQKSFLDTCDLGQRKHENWISWLLRRHSHRGYVSFGVCAVLMLMKTWFFDQYLRSSWYFKNFRLFFDLRNSFLFCSCEKKGMKCFLNFCLMSLF